MLKHATSIQRHFHFQVFRDSRVSQQLFILHSVAAKRQLYMMSSQDKAKAENVALIACGSFNPVTFMHLRMMECARDHLLQNAPHLSVIGGYLSPVSDGYGKAGLIKANHRLKMCDLGLQSTLEQWVETLTWESDQGDWLPTLTVLKELQRQIVDVKKREVRTMLVCGSDFLHSFGKEGLWLDKDVEDILKNHGLVVVTRPKFDSEEFIKQNKLVSSLRKHIYLVEELCSNDLSSTVVRKAVKNQQSIKYLVPDPVVHYIAEHDLYREEEFKNQEKLAPYAKNKERNSNV